MKILFFCIIFYSILSSDEFITPLPKNISYNKDKALLGKKLFFDTKLSKDNTISCTTCHNLDLGGSDNLAFSFGINAQQGHINAPTVLNSSFNFRQMWDGRVKTLAEQAVFPIENPIEMGNSFENIIKTLSKEALYIKEFNKIYKDGITKNNIIDALEEFQKTLITQSPFDDYLRGDKDAITQIQKEGYEIFKEKGCVTCHNGVNIGGASYAKLGIINPRETKNLGLYNVTKDEMDKFFFKVPTLRNVELTYPYFHDAKVSTLKDAIKVIANIQLGIDLNKDEILKIEEFLKSLTGKVEIIE